MDEIKLHINPSNEPEEDSSILFSQLEIPWEKSKARVWEELSARINEIPERKQSRIIPLVYTLSLAAMIVLLVGMTIFLRLYSTSVSCPTGQVITAQLPDGSTVELNDGSRISYHPYWWQINRQVSFEGEGFFKVEKGRKFEVTSLLAKTIVLGTSFNIYSRNDQYRVSCFTGRVKVVSKTDGQVVLNPDERAIIQPDGTIEKQINQKSEPPAVNDGNRFFFTGTPISRVFEEISRHYDVPVIIKIEKEYYYTGNFTSEKPVGDVLELVCKPFNLSFAKQNDGSYLVFQNK